MPGLVVWLISLVSLMMAAAAGLASEPAPSESEEGYRRYGVITTIRVDHVSKSMAVSADSRSLTTHSSEMNPVAIRERLYAPHVHDFKFNIKPLSEWHINRESDEAVWFLLKVENVSTRSRPLNLVLVLTSSIHDKVEVFSIEQPNGDIQVKKKTIFNPEYGSNKRRINRTRYPVYGFFVDKKQTKELLVKVTRPGPLNVDPVAYVWSYDAFAQYSQIESTSDAIFIGLMLSVSAISLLFMVTLREFVYFYFSFACFAFSIFCYYITGSGIATIWPEFSHINDVIGRGAAILTMVFALITSHKFLKMNLLLSLGQWTIKGLVIAGASLFIYNIFFEPNDWMVPLYCLASLVAASSLSLFCWVLGSRPALLFFIGWMSMLASAVLYATVTFGITDTLDLAEDMVLVGSATGVLLFLAGLMGTFYVDRQNQLVLLRDRHEAAMKLKQAETRLVHRALHSRSTGLPNRTLLMSALEAQLSDPRTQQNGLTLALIGVGNFSEFNNTLGHENGDRILQKLANRLADVVCRMDTVVMIEHSFDGRTHQMAIVDGVVFALVLKNANVDYLMDQCKLILSKMNEPVEYEGLYLDVQSRIGACVMRNEALDSNNLLRRAEIALEAATDDSHSIKFYSHDIDPYNETKLTLLGDLRQAMDTSALQLYYQPQIDVNTGWIVGVEALIRWLHPEHGMMLPHHFIPLAERTGVIHPLTLWVLKRALMDFKVMADEGIEVVMSINLSARNLYHRNFSDDVIGLCQSAYVDPKNLLFEITETGIMTNADEAIDVIASLAEKGIKISIDDFGTGHSSLAYLQKLPVTQMKLDQSFIKDLPDDQGDRVLVETMIQMGQSMGLEIVAEGVEKAAALDYLASIGCNIAQGFFIAVPMPFDECVRWCKQQNNTAR